MGHMRVRALGDSQLQTLGSKLGREHVEGWSREGAWAPGAQDREGRVE